MMEGTDWAGGGGGVWKGGWKGERLMHACMDSSCRVEARRVEVVHLSWVDGWMDG